MSLLRHHLSHGFRFLLVGASGVIPNLTCVWALTSIGVNYLVAAVLATQLAIAWNFILIDAFVFDDLKRGRRRSRASVACWSGTWTSPSGSSG